jgi:creatinine amidohydrolase/Fe(II)-dependent formamide hydrolase-like protein
MVALTCAFVPGSQYPDPKEPRPIDALDTVFIEEMTWMEVRDALAAGKTTAIVATGGIEQNGPYLATGKHNYVLRATTEAVARELGNALVAPIIKLVPEGDIDPPSSHMKYAGTISLQQETFRRVLVDVCSSLKTHGFENLVLIGDSGGNQKGMRQVAEELSAAWKGGKTRILYIPEYYDSSTDLDAWLEEQGIHQVSEGLHDDFGTTAIMMTVDPATVRMEQRLAKGLFRINGVELAPADETIELGMKGVEFRARRTVDAVRKALAIEASSSR